MLSLSLLLPSAGKAEVSCLSYLCKVERDGGGDGFCGYCVSSVVIIARQCESSYRISVIIAAAVVAVVVAAAIGTTVTVSLAFLIFRW